MIQGPRKIHFNALPKETRIRLTEILNRKSDPEPIHVIRSGGRVGAIFMALIGALVLFVAWVVDMDSSFVGVGGFVALSSGAIIFVGGIVMFLHRRCLRAALPFRSGTYIFASEFIEARGPVLKCYSMSDLQNVG